MEAREKKPNTCQISIPSGEKGSTVIQRANDKEFSRIWNTLDEAHQNLCRINKNKSAPSHVIVKL